MSAYIDVRQAVMDRMYLSFRWLALGLLTFGAYLAAPAAVQHLPAQAVTIFYSLATGITLVLLYYCFNENWRLISVQRSAHETELEKLLADVTAIADTDALTGLLNHRSFHKCLREQTALAAKNEQAMAVIVIDLDNFRFFNDAYGHIVGDQVLVQVAQTLNNAALGFGFLHAARFGGDEFALLLPGLAANQMTSTIQEIQSLFDHLGYRPIGYDLPIPLSVSVGIALYPDDAATAAEALSIADDRLMRSKNGGKENAVAKEMRQSVNNSIEGFSMLDALVTAVDNKDRYTRRHSEDVLVYALEIADALGLDQEAKTTLGIAALLHDVGKIGVSDVILRKPGRLTNEEFDAIRQHPEIGCAIVGAVDGFQSIMQSIRHHHERIDGAGYPAGLAADQIPLQARIMAVADAFSAMTTDRPYRRGMTVAEADAMLLKGAGTQWDAQIVNAFITRRRMQIAA
jgi:diguanylate cyclase (GGDEF)-like protein